MILLSVLLTFAFVVGGTWTGVFQPSTVALSFFMLTGAVATWLSLRGTRRWRWRRSPLDFAMPFWAVAFAASALNNQAQIGRIAIGLWFAGLYLVLWYALHDGLANWLNRKTLIDAVLVAGAFVLASGVYDLNETLAGGRYRLLDLGFEARLRGSLDNPNIFGGFLVMLIPLAVGRLLSVRGMWRLILGAYTLLAIAMIWFSGSRGAWIGLVAAVVVMAGLILRAKFPETLRRLWPLGAGAIVVIGLIVGLIVTLRPDPGRSVIYEDAFNRFLSAPLTGHGLFTYKIYVPEPVELRMHIHAHNIFLQIAVELGLIGLAALVVSMYLVARSAWLNWREARGPDAWVMVGAIGALVGFTGHQLLDFPVLTPCVAIMLVACLVIATTGVSPQPVKAKPAWQLAAVVLLAVVIIGVGFYINANQPQLLLIAVNYYP